MAHFHRTSQDAPFLCKLWTPHKGCVINSFPNVFYHGTNAPGHTVKYWVKQMPVRLGYQVITILVWISVELIWLPVLSPDRMQTSLILWKLFNSITIYDSFLQQARSRWSVHGRGFATGVEGRKARKALCSTAIQLSLDSVTPVYGLARLVLCFSLLSNTVAGSSAQFSAWQQMADSPCR